MSGGRRQTRYTVGQPVPKEERWGAFRRGRSMSGGHDEQLCRMGDARSRGVDPDQVCWSCRLMPWRCTALEHLDDDHATTAAWTSRLAGICGGTGGFAVGVCNGEQFTHTCDVGGAGALGEQAVVADAMQAFWQHV